jgi:hypothetical protein
MNMPRQSPTPEGRKQLAAEYKERQRIKRSFAAAEAKADRTLAGLPPKYDGPAQSTVEVLMYELRERGVDGLKKPYTRRRLADCSVKQVQTIIERLSKLKLRPEYSNVTDELIEALSEQIK